MGDPLPNKVDQFMTQLMGHQRRLFQYIHLLLPRQQDAEDVMQNTLVVLWKKYDQFAPGTNFYSWACRAAYLEAKNYRRRNGRLVTVLDDATFERIAVAASEQFDLLEVRREAMERCMDKLRPFDRELIGLRYLPGATVKRLAEQLGRPANSVCKSLSRIRQSLWNCINDELAQKTDGDSRIAPAAPREDER